MGWSGGQSLAYSGDQALAKLELIGATHLQRVFADKIGGWANASPAEIGVGSASYLIRLKFWTHPRPAVKL